MAASSWNGVAAGNGSLIVNVYNPTAGRLAGGTVTTRILSFDVTA